MPAFKQPTGFEIASPVLPNKRQQLPGKASVLPTQRQLVAPVIQGWLKLSGRTGATVRGVQFRIVMYGLQDDLYSCDSWLRNLSSNPTVNVSYHCDDPQHYHG